MKLVLIKIASIAQTQWSALIVLVQGNSDHHFPIVVARTTEGQIMDGPRGLQLITPFGPKPVYKTASGFMAYNPMPHILQPAND